MIITESQQKGIRGLYGQWTPKLGNASEQAVG